MNLHVMEGTGDFTAYEVQLTMPFDVEDIAKEVERVRYEYGGGNV